MFVNLLHLFYIFKRPSWKPKVRNWRAAGGLTIIVIIIIIINIIIVTIVNKNDKQIKDMNRKESTD